MCYSALNVVRVCADVLLVLQISGVKVIKDLVKNEGAGAFFKGLTPKVRLSSSPSPFFD